MPRRERARPRILTSGLRLLLIAVLIIAVGGADPSTGPSNGHPRTATPTDGRPMDGGDSEPVVFAHYFPPYPLSLDNQPAEQDYYQTHYLTPTGENGIHAAYGGLLRDRPLPVPPGTGDWRLRNLKIEIGQAKAAGVDGFLVDLLSPSGSNWETTTTLMQAAAEVGGFVVVPMVDATASFAGLPPAEAADRIATLLSYPSAYRTEHGYRLSSFAAERLPPSWWRAVIDALETEHQLPISFQAVFLNAGPQNLLAFASIADGYGNWGTRTAAQARQAIDYTAIAHGMGKTWMAPVAVQDFRPRSYAYAEASNTATLRAMWTDAISDGADLVQLVTWNDYSESTQFAPSVAHGTCFADISRYYSDWFRSGTQPPIAQQGLYLTHRVQRADAPPLTGQRLAEPGLGGAHTDPQNRVEVLTFLNQPGSVQVSVGDRRFSYTAAAGITARTFELRPGTVSAELTQGGNPVLQLTSPYEVLHQPEVQDLQYYASCTRRS